MGAHRNNDLQRTQTEQENKQSMEASMLTHRNRLPQNATPLWTGPRSEWPLKSAEAIESIDIQFTQYTKQCNDFFEKWRLMPAGNYRNHSPVNRCA
jgi:hypothetical protein